MEDNKSVVRYHLKSDLDEGRRVYLKKEVYDYIMNFCNKMKYKSDSYVFDFYKDGMPLTRKTISKIIKSCLKIRFRHIYHLMDLDIRIHYL